MSKSNLKLALITFAKSHPEVWDKTIVCSEKKRVCPWTKFADGFNLPIDEVRKRWNGIRRMYYHELKSVLIAGRQSNWTYFPLMDSFLRGSYEKMLLKDGYNGTNQGSVTEFVDLSCDDDTIPLSSSFASGIPPVSSSQETDQSRTTLPPVVPEPKTTQEPNAPARRTPVKNQSRKEIPRSAMSSTNSKMIKNLRNALHIRLRTNGGPHRSKLKHPNRPTTYNSERGSQLEGTAKARLVARCGEMTPLRKETLSAPDKTTGSCCPTMNEKNPSINSTYPKNSIQLPTPCKADSESQKFAENSRSFIAAGSKIIQNQVKIKNSELSVEPVIHVVTKTKPPLQKEQVENSKTIRGNSLEPKIKEPSRSVKDEEELPSSTKPAIKGADWIAAAVDEWRAETTESVDSVGEIDSHVDSEARKNFLVSFLPDMAEMSVEQRKFFKAKLMYLICNIDQFS